jgi:hypothetical protein
MSKKLIRNLLIYFSISSALMVFSYASILTATGVKVKSMAYIGLLHSGLLILTLMYRIKQGNKSS